MANYYLSRKYKTEAAKSFKEVFAKNDNRTVGYIYLSKSTNYANDNVVSTITDTAVNEKSIWDNMIAAKKVFPGDIEYVIPRYVWSANTKYKQYDDTVELDFLLSTTYDENDERIIYPMYVMNTQGDVYKCLCNNVSGLSTVEPTGNYNENDGFIYTADSISDSTGYLWKYLYNVRDSNKFLTDDWMPVPYAIANVSNINYDIGNNNLLDGGLSKIVITSRGEGYTDTTVNVQSFAISSDSIIISDDIDLSSSNIKLNMSVSGQGIIDGTYITGLTTETKTVTLSNPTISAGGGTFANSITFSTRIVIEGDGSGTLTDYIYANTQISKIEVINSGVGYTRANVIIYGSGTGASARVVLPPKFGHGYNPAVELAANNVMVLSRIGDVDASESGIIPTDVSFRQYGLLTSPIKYGNSSPVDYANANTVISQLSNVTLLSGAEYLQNEQVFQGSPTSKTFEGYVVSQTSTVVKLSNVYGTISVGAPLIGANSSVSRPVVSLQNSEFQPYAGDILYNNNILKVDRSIGQAEEIKLVFQF
jgi:hypothetical protein